MPVSGLPAGPFPPFRSGRRQRRRVHAEPVDAQGREIDQRGFAAQHLGYELACDEGQADAAVVIEEKDLTGEKLVSTVSDMLAQPGKLAEMGKNARSLSVDDSLDRIADALMKLVQK